MHQAKSCIPGAPACQECHACFSKHKNFCSACQEESCVFRQSRKPGSEMIHTHTYTDIYIHTHIRGPVPSAGIWNCNMVWTFWLLTRVASSSAPRTFGQRSTRPASCAGLFPGGFLCCSRRRTDSQKRLHLQAPVICRTCDVTH